MPIHGYHYMLRVHTDVAKEANNLKEEGIIKSEWLFNSFVRFTGSGEKLQAGTYELKPGEGIAALFLTFRSGHNQQDITVTIPEGYTLAQIGEGLQQKLAIDPIDWQMAVAVSSDLNDLVVASLNKPASVDLEGYLFPDTYRFIKGVTAHEVASTMIQTLRDKLETNAEMLGTIKNIHELLTLASILEREVVSDGDRAIVADIFLRRLEIGMALQADSTVNYITGKDTPSISLTDRDIDSPYNTYQNPGLPPGPICNPGLSAIFAAANPIVNEYWYFLTDSDGQVHYAKTYEEHLQNKARYLY